MYFMLTRYVKLNLNYDIFDYLMQSASSNFTKGVAFAKAHNYSEALKAFTAAI
jgi:hypothetical protein